MAQRSKTRRVAKFSYANCHGCGNKLGRDNESGYCASCFVTRLNKERAGENHHAWVGDAVGYLGRHDRIYHRRGKASEYDCVDCGKQAEDWSQKKGTSGTNTEDYDPRCTRCHMRYDPPRERDSYGRFA